MHTKKFGDVKWHINKENVVPIQKRSFSHHLPGIKRCACDQSALDIKPITKQSSILELTYHDQIPGRAYFLFLITSLLFYGRTSKEFKTRMYDNTLPAFLMNVSGWLQMDWAVLKKNLQSFKSSQGIVDLSAEGTLFLDQLKQTDSKISELDVQMKWSNRSSNMLQDAITQAVLFPLHWVWRIPLTGLLNELFKAEFDLEKLKREYRKKSTDRSAGRPDRKT